MRIQRQRTKKHDERPKVHGCLLPKLDTRFDLPFIECGDCQECTPLSQPGRLKMRKNSKLSLVEICIVGVRTFRRSCLRILILCRQSIPVQRFIPIFAGQPQLCKHQNGRSRCSVHSPLTLTISSQDASSLIPSICLASCKLMVLVPRPTEFLTCSATPAFVPSAS
jgi:hypothetical protein